MERSLERRDVADKAPVGPTAFAFAVFGPSGLRSSIWKRLLGGEERRGAEAKAKRQTLRDDLHIASAWLVIRVVQGADLGADCGHVDFLIEDLPKKT